MTSVEDVATESGRTVDDVLAACRDLGIVASSGLSGLSTAEHRALRSALGAPDDLAPVTGGSTQRDPHGPPPAEQRTLVERHRELVEASRPRRRLAPSTRTRWIVSGALLLVCAVIVAMVGREEDAAEGERLLAYTESDEGACLDLREPGEAPGPEQDLVTTVACDAAHDAELIDVWDLGTDPATTDAGPLDAGPDADHPGVGLLRDLAETRCGAAFEDAVGAVATESPLDVVLLVPTPGTWAVGDRTVLCLLEDPGGPLVGRVVDR